MSLLLSVLALYNRIYLLDCVVVLVFKFLGMTITNFMAKKKMIADTMDIVQKKNTDSLFSVEVYSQHI